MAYFPNGTSGMRYLEQYCLRCINWKTREDETIDGCPIWDVHTLYNYSRSSRPVLDQLIPMDKEGIYPQKCKMFEWNGEYEGQMEWT